MAIATTCPNCKARFRLGDDLVGKKVKCQGCAHVFVVPSAAQAAAEPWSVAPPPKPKAEAPPEPEASVPLSKADPDETRVMPPKVTAAPPEHEEDEEEEEERVEKKRSSGPPPTSKSGSSRRERPESGSNVTMIAVIVVVLGFGLVSCLGCVVGGGYWAFAVRAPAKQAPAPIAGGDKVVNPPGDLNKDGPKPIVNAPAGAIRADFAFDGVFRQNNQLNQFDKRNPDGKIHKLYAVHFEANRNYQIDMMSNQFDAFLYLTDDTGRVLMTDDDGGEGLNSRIFFMPKVTGTYLIEATSLGGNRFGAYTLVVQRR